MIHGSTTDPVLVKKIALRVWTLRSEIEASIRQNIIEKGKDPSPEEISNLAKIYSGEAEAPAINNQDNVIDSDSEIEGEDDAEALMAAAIAGDDAEGSDSEEESTESDEGPSAAPEDKNKIIQKRPPMRHDLLFNAKTILTEVYMEKMFFFCSQHFLEGESIVIEFLVPKKFILNAQVVFSTQYNMKSRIISSNKLPFRTGIVFTFLKPGERTLLRNFLLSVEAEKGVAAPTPSATDDDDMDLDGLDDI